MADEDLGTYVRAEWLRLSHIYVCSLLGIYQRMIVRDYVLLRQLPREHRSMRYSPWQVVLRLDGAPMCEKYVEP